MNIVKVHLILLSFMLISLPHSYAETTIANDVVVAEIVEEAVEEESTVEMLSELVDDVVTEIEDVVDVEPLKTKTREVEVIADEEFSDFMYRYPGLVEKLRTERLASRNPYVLLPHKPNYFMPLTHQTKINQEEQEDFYNGVRIENGETQQKPGFDHTEFVFQLSVKYIVADNILGKFSTLSVAYTNKSYWQAYNDSVSAVFRETNHEPEIILGFKAFQDWADFWTLSFNHQSNGQVGSLSRSWNRIILGATKVWPNKLLYVRAWYRIPEESKSDKMDSIGDDNPDIHKHLGYGDIFYLRKSGDHSISATIRNNLDINNNVGSIELDWTYPLPGNVKGFIQYFNGYGESLIDYDQYQERIGIGIKITDWL